MITLRINTIATQVLTDYFNAAPIDFKEKYCFHLIKNETFFLLEIRNATLLQTLSFECTTLVHSQCHKSGSTMSSYNAHEHRGKTKQLPQNMNRILL